MDQKEKAEIFTSLHIAGDPVILFNIWDAGSANAVKEAGAKAVATGSWSVAAANGFTDGEQVPLDFAIANLERITTSVDLPISIDFEGGYAADTATLKENILRAIDAGAVGINFEDQIVGGDELYSIADQSQRIRAVREAAESKSVPLYINARTDIFLKNGPADHEAYFNEAAERAAAYSEAGASGFFAPGLKDPELIRRLCKLSPLPVNIMVMSDTPSNAEMAALGVARISYGPIPWLQVMESLKSAAKAVFEL